MIPFRPAMERDPVLSDGAFKDSSPFQGDGLFQDFNRRNGTFRHFSLSRDDGLFRDYSLNDGRLWNDGQFRDFIPSDRMVDFEILTPPCRWFLLGIQLLPGWRFLSRGVGPFVAKVLFENLVLSRTKIKN